MCTVQYNKTAKRENLDSIKVNKTNNLGSQSKQLYNYRKSMSVDEIDHETLPDTFLIAHTCLLLSRGQLYGNIYRLWEIISTRLTLPSCQMHHKTLYDPDLDHYSAFLTLHTDVLINPDGILSTAMVIISAVDSSSKTFKNKNVSH